LTFDGARFGRSVAGARALLRPVRPRGSGVAPAGVLLDVAAVETIVPPPPAAPSAAPAPATPAGPPRTGAPVAPHRRPLVVRTDTAELMRADAEVRWSPPEPRLPPVPPVGMSWTPERGFRLPGADPAGRRVHRSRAHVEATGPDESAARPGDVEQSQPPLRYLPAAGPRHTAEARPAPPPDVVAAVAVATGVHVGDAVIDRSPAVTEQADELGALAFTRDGVVHLPPDLGPLDDPAVRSVLAHELTHVAQRRRRGGDVPAEGSPEGLALEAEARRVQGDVHTGRPVVPAFRRRHPGARREGPVGVQRLTADEDPYAWQDRPDVREAAEARALWGDRGWSRTGAGARAEADTARERHREFEVSDKARLERKRRDRWDELEAEAVREAHTEAAREEREYEGLTRADLLALRAQLDDEMPFEFGFPPGIDPYPGPPLPEPTEEERRRELSSSRIRRSTGRGRAPLGGTRTRRAPVIGGPGRGRGLRSLRGTEESRYEWQEREPSDREALGALFGGSILGSLFGMTVTDTDEKASRERAEKDRLDDLLGQRKTREQNLRHMSLQRHRTEAVREQPEVPAEGSTAPPSPFPIALSDDEINDIRAQVDEEMPLEFHALRAEDYLSRRDHTQIDALGNIGELTVDRPASPAPAPPSPPPAERTTTTPAPVPATPGQPAARAPAPPSPAAAAVPTTAPAATPPAPPDAPVAPAVAATPAVTATTDPGGGAALAGAAAGAAVTTGVGRLLDDGDAHDADELMARRVFAAATDIDLDSLTRRLYSRIRRELRTELIVDRERSGSLADMR
jgi:hypothetical protein